MTPWLAAAFLLAVGLGICGLGCMRGGAVDRLVFVELATTIATLLLVVLATHEGRAFYYDVALIVALTSLVSTLAFSRFLEHWL